MTDSNATVPELVAGDRLTRAEFERRYRSMPTSCAPTAATACASTSSGGCSTGHSTGSCCAASDDGLLQSEVFPGLWLDRDALLRGDLQAVGRSLDRGLGSAAHATWTAELARRANS